MSSGRLSKYNDEQFAEIIHAKRVARMENMDKFPKELRELVHVYGYTIVDTLMCLGVRKPRHIKHIVEMILDEFSPTRGSFVRQGIRTDVIGTPKVAPVTEPEMTEPGGGS